MKEYKNLAIFNAVNPTMLYQVVNFKTIDNFKGIAGGKYSIYYNYNTIIYIF